MRTLCIVYAVMLNSLYSISLDHYGNDPILISLYSTEYSLPPNNRHLTVQAPGWVHQAVYRSLLRGLSLLGVHYNINPYHAEQLGDVVLVPANLDALRAAIGLKEHGRIKYLLAGPNLVVCPTEHDSLVAHPAIDRCIVPCEWVKTFYEKDEPALRERIAIWPAGVDTSYWNPSLATSTSKTVLVYQKNASSDLCSHVERLLQRYGWNTYRVTYGTYDQNSFKLLLDTARFAIFLSRSESQGIALAECWSMNVPTLVWDPQEPVWWGAKMGWPISSAPYLTERTGAFWHTPLDLESLLINIDTILAHTAPRSWIIENMSDEVSARRLLEIIAELKAAQSSIPQPTS